MSTSSGVVDIFIYDSAAVNWRNDYDKLKAFNVASTLQLLRAAVRSKPLKKFVFVSGGLGSDSWSKMVDNGASQAT